MDLSVEESAQRMDKRDREIGQSKDRFEKEKQDFHQRVRDFYLQMAKEKKDEWLVLDARKSPKEICQELIAALRKKGLLNG